MSPIPLIELYFCIVYELAMHLQSLLINQRAFVFCHKVMYIFKRNCMQTSHVLELVSLIIISLQYCYMF